MLKTFLAGVLSVAMLIASAVAQAQDYPNKPIRLVVPYPAGGVTDVIARVLADEVSKTIGQRVIVDNRPGAAGNVGSDLVAKSAPDGYTLLMALIGNTISMSLYKDVPYDFQRDLTPTEVAPIAMRALLMAGWALWLGLAMSLVAAIFEARGSALRSWVPRFALFAGLTCYAQRRNLEFIEEGVPGGYDFSRGHKGMPGGGERERGPSRAEQRKYKEALKRQQQEQQEQAEVDRILAKIAATGMDSLSRAERRVLERATENKRRRG